MRGAAVLGLLLALGGCATVSARSAPGEAAAAPAVPPAMQYLYGSGEAAAATQQAWTALLAHVAQALRARPADGVVLAPDATLARPRFVPCGDKPPAAVFDVDETVLLNYGAEYDAAVHPGPFDPQRWDAYERTGGATVTATPGAQAALAALRAEGVAVVFNSNRAAANAEATVAAIDGAGIGPAVHGRTLFLQGDDATGGHKDGRRATIASRFCVLAMAGDQLGDFSDLFNRPALAPAARRAAVEAAPVAMLWGRGWFMMPNPVYGPQIKGGLDDIFPAGRRWSPQEAH